MELLATETTASDVDSSRMERPATETTASDVDSSMMEVLAASHLDVDSSSIQGTFAGGRDDAASKGFFEASAFCHLTDLCCFNISL